MTQNLFIGADVSPVLSTSDASEVADLVDALLAQAQASDVPARVAAIARIVAEHQPDVIGLQEAAIWRVQAPADGSGSPAETVAIDILAELLAAFEVEGLDYTPAAVREGIDLEVSGTTQDVRLTDREVVLVRDGLAIDSALTGDFESNLTLPSPLGGEVTILRGWAAVDVSLGDQPVRVVTTHIEVGPFAGVQEAQVAEIRAGPANVEGPVVVLGDINDGPTGDAYEELLGEELEDAWLSSEAPVTTDGATCCYDTTLLGDSTELSERIDIVAAGQGAHTRAATRVVDAPADRTSDGRWPSDHAGVVVTLGVP